MANRHESTKKSTEPTAEGSFPTWPLIIIGFLVGHVVLMLVMVYLAVSDQSFAVEPDYYNKAMRWDKTREAQLASAALGWQVEIQVAEEADLHRNRAFQCVLTDQEDQPIQGAEVEIIAFSHARGNQWHSVLLDPGPDGQYHGRMRFERSGSWEFRITALRGEDTFIHREKISVSPASGEKR